MSKKHFFILIVAGIIAVVAFGSTAKASDVPVINMDGGSSWAFHVSAVLSGTINPRGSLTSYWFEFGTRENNLNRKTQEFSVGFGREPVIVRHTVTDLIPNTTYFFRLVGRWGARHENVIGDVRSFRTANNPPPGPITQTHYNQTVCHNGPNPENPGDCGGITCSQLCTNPNYSDFTFGGRSTEACTAMVRNTASWSQYIATSRWVNQRDAAGLIFDSLSFGFELGLVRNCSTGDKCLTDTCQDAASPLLRFGRCDCTAGSAYKICCARSGGVYTPVLAINATGQDDRISPQEGMCPGGAQQEHRGTQCPIIDPIISLTASPSTISPGESTTLTWATTGLTDCSITRVGPGGETGGLGNVQPNGSAPSDPRTLGEHTYTLNCRRTENPAGRLTSVVTITVGAHWWFCNNDRVCERTTSLYSTAEACQAAVLQWRGIRTFCYRERSDCERDCASLTLPAPVVSCGTHSATRIDISWDNMTDETGYEILRCDNEGCVPITIVSRIDPNVITWADAGLNQNNIYRYRVRALYAGGSVVSNIAECRTLSGNPCTIDNFSATPSTISAGQTATLAWDSTRTTACHITGIGSISSRGSREVSPTSTTTYTLNCNTVGHGAGCSRSVTVTVPAECPMPNPSDCPIATPAPPPPCPPITPITAPTFNEPPGCFSGPLSLFTSRSVINNRDCLPFRQEGDNPIPERCPQRQIVTTGIEWAGRVENMCNGIIPGSSPNNTDIRCWSTTSNWAFNIAGSGSVTRRETPLCPTVTQTYSAMCRRAPHMCFRQRTFTGYGFSGAHGPCEADCASIRPNPLVAGCSCSTDCLQRGPRCVQFSTCTRLITCTRTIIDPSGLTREESYPCLEYFDCEPCLEFECLNNIYRSNQDANSRSLCHQLVAVPPQQIRVIQPPCITPDSLKTDPVRLRILLNHFINLIWRVEMPDSGVSTTMMCTPRVALGDGEGWTRGTGIPSILLDSLSPSGRRDNLSPNVTTRYQLFCRNRDLIDPNRCFSDSRMMEQEVKVFTPDLREVPAFYDSFIRIVGRITDNLFR